MLERIHGHEDIKKLTTTELSTLCQELRTKMVQTVAANGGHLASNLGVVELTVAIHRVFDTARDRLVFDVGHQCYVHKLLTGRAEAFSSLRQLGGLSGFPKPRESVHDAFVAGHASASVSVALGMARARTLQKQDYAVLALIGDGSMGGGLAFEGLDDAGSSGEPLIVILNDNGMSIDKNVGALSRHLLHLRTRPGYYAMKDRYRRAMETTPVGEKLYEVSRDIKKSLKKSLLPGSSMFENMGFSYMGPVDGHDVEALCAALIQARDRRCPVLLHVRTEKGKGYFPAQREPWKFHGIGPFDSFTGRPLKSGGEDFSAVFGAALTELAGEEERICAITAAMLDGTGLSIFQEKYPQRLFDVGIAEGHAVSMAGGMAKQGLLPVFAVYSSFLQRGYDMLWQDVSLEKLHVVLAVDRAGLVGADGETHHGCMDALYLTQLPHMTVLCPASFAELRAMLRHAVMELDGPVAIRYPRGGEQRYTACAAPEGITVLQEGGETAIVTYGILTNEVLEAAEMLAAKGISARVVKLNAIAPLDETALLAALDGVKTLLVLEDCLANGCVGQRIASLLACHGRTVERMILKNAGDKPVPHGSVPQLNGMLGLDAAGVVRAIEEAHDGK